MDLVGRDVGTYRILSLLGRGGSAEVYKAFHPALKREVALKVLLQEVSQDLDWVRRFRQEAELLGRLDHPHILPIYDAGEHEGRPFLVMKYMVDTTTLRSQLQGHPWPLNRVVKVVGQVADALDAAHQAGVVHRDIKPSNILVSPDLRCSVFDFGIAKPFRRGDTTTGSDLIVGTPEFMSPEQCKGDRIDHRSDIYSLGVMTYQMLSGHVPFTAETAVGILMKHLTEPLPIPPRGVALPPAVNGVLVRAMAREPKDRFPTAGALASRLKESADQRATVTIHASGMRRAAISTLKLPSWIRNPRSRPFRLALAGSLLALALIAVQSLGPLRSRDPSTPPTPAHPLPPPAVGGLPGEEGDAARERAPEESRPDPVESPGDPGIPPGANLATLEIDSSERAQIRLDGRLAGTAPGVLRSVSPGEHVLVLDAGGGRVREETLWITPGSVHRVRVDFTDAAGSGASPSATPGARSARGPRVAASAPREAPRVREWTGFLTDEDCGATGGAQGTLHLRCAERCIREGRKPMLYSRGRLYRLEGLERIELLRGEPLRLRGVLEDDTIRVAAPGALDSSSSGNPCGGRPPAARPHPMGSLRGGARAIPPVGSAGCSRDGNPRGSRFSPEPDGGSVRTHPPASPKGLVRNRHPTGSIHDLVAARNCKPDATGSEERRRDDPSPSEGLPATFCGGTERPTVASKPTRVESRAKV